MSTITTVARNRRKYTTMHVQNTTIERGGGGEQDKPNEREHPHDDTWDMTSHLTSRATNTTRSRQRPCTVNACTRKAHHSSTNAVCAVPSRQHLYFVAFLDCFLAFLRSAVDPAFRAARTKGKNSMPPINGCNTSGTKTPSSSVPSAVVRVP